MKGGEWRLCGVAVCGRGWAVGNDPVMVGEGQGRQLSEVVL